MDNRSNCKSNGQAETWPLAASLVNPDRSLAFPASTVVHGHWWMSPKHGFQPSWARLMLSFRSSLSPPDLSPRGTASMVCILRPSTTYLSETGVVLQTASVMNPAASALWAAAGARRSLSTDSGNAVDSAVVVFLEEGIVGLSLPTVDVRDATAKRSLIWYAGCPGGPC